MLDKPYVAVWQGVDGPVIATGNGANIAHLHSAARVLDAAADRAFAKYTQPLLHAEQIEIEGHGVRQALVVSFKDGWPLLIAYGRHETSDEVSPHELWEAALVCEVKARHEVTKGLLIQERNQLSSASRILR